MFQLRGDHYLYTPSTPCTHALQVRVQSTGAFVYKLNVEVHQSVRWDAVIAPQIDLADPMTTYTTQCGITKSVMPSDWREEDRPVQVLGQADQPSALMIRSTELVGRLYADITSSIGTTLAKILVTTGIPPTTSQEAVHALFWDHVVRDDEKLFEVCHLAPEIGKFFCGTLADALVSAAADKEQPRWHILTDFVPAIRARWGNIALLPFIRYALAQPPVIDALRALANVDDPNTIKRYVDTFIGDHVQLALQQVSERTGKPWTSLV